jgi:hypothetical protein
MEVKEYGNYWAVYDAEGRLKCVSRTKEGAEELAKLLQEKEDTE